MNTKWSHKKIKWYLTTETLILKCLFKHIVNFWQRITPQKIRKTTTITTLQIITTKKVYTPAGGRLNEWGNHVYYVRVCIFSHFQNCWKKGEIINLFIFLFSRLETTKCYARMQYIITALDSHLHIKIKHKTFTWLNVNVLGHVTGYKL